MATDYKEEDAEDIAEGFDSSSGRLGLGVACERGDVEEVQWLLHSGVDVDTEFEWGFTGLIKAASRGHAGVVTVLLGKGVKSGSKTLATVERRAANVNHQSQDGTSALHRAAYNGHTLIVKILLNARAKIDIRARDGETPLMAAANNGHLSCIELLLGAGANVNHQGKQYGNTALILAASRLHRQCVLRLLSAGAAVNVTTKFGDSALIRAAGRGNLEIVDILLDADADPDLYNTKHKTALDLAREKKHRDVEERLFPLTEPRPRRVETLHPPVW